MPVRIEIQTSAVERRVKAAFDAGLGALSREVLKDCNRFCKRDTGALIASSLAYSQPDRGVLVWRTPYARRQYWAIPASGGGGTWRWCEAAKRRCARRWRDLAQRNMGERL